jgi:ATP-dependent DNA helicase DinG
MVLDAEEPGWVCWVEPVPPVQGGAQAWGAPIDVGPLLQAHLYSAKDSVVLTSATMTVNGATDYFRRRLGIGLIEPERLGALILGTVFDYARQSLVLVPTFLPEPDDRERDYAAELCAFLGRLFRETHGRALALFTSHEMLQRCAAPLRQDLAADGIRVFAQGLSGSRESLLQRLASDPQTVLLGAHSFWEGVDVVGPNLSCVVLARLPFAVHTDPIVSARCEAIERDGGNAFMEYSLPAAVIRFRQGFGRLIRHRRDRGVIVVADRRIVSKRYGQWFRASIPTPVRPCQEARELIAAVTAFLDA